MVQNHTTKKLIDNFLNKAIKGLSSCLLKKDTNVLIKDDVRGALFAVEGILRLYLRGNSGLSKNDLKKIDSCFVQIKHLEDNLGKLSLSHEMVDYCEKNNFSAKIYNKSKDYALKENNSFLKSLESNSSINCLKNISKELKSIEWPRKENKYIKDIISIEISKTLEKVKKLDVKILADSYTYFELEEGFHEWRRKIRWISIYIQAYKHLFGLEFNRKKDLKKYKTLVENYKNDPFCQLSKSNYKFSINAVKYYQLSDYIKRIGKIKSKGEMPYIFNEFLGIKIENDPVEYDAHTIYKQFLKDKVLKNFILA